MSDDLNQQIGRLEAHVENLHRDMSELKTELKNISAMMHKWKGAGAILALVGIVFGFFVEGTPKTGGKIISKGTKLSPSTIIEMKKL